MKVHYHPAPLHPNVCIITPNKHHRDKGLVLETPVHS